MEATNRRRAWIVSIRGADAGTSAAEPRVWGLTASERLRRCLLRAGVSRIDHLAPGEPVPACDDPCVVVREDLFYDERILAGLMDSERVVLRHAVDGDEETPVAAACDPQQLPDVARLFFDRDRQQAPPEGVRFVGILDLASAYNPALRKLDPPFVYPASGPARELEGIENRVFAASYKGITDLVTKWVFPLPARAVVRVLARRGVKPNTVTSVSYVLAIAVTWLFYEGWFGTGLALGWLMTFLDTVDGKLARCTLTSTRFGNVFDHGLDLVHPPIWWAAWGMALPGGVAGNELAFWVVVAGYVIGRGCEALFTLSFGIQFFVWRPFDAFFRQIIARRNPNMILLSLSLLIGQPVWGFRAIAVWTVVGILVAATRNVQAHIEARRGVRIRSWLDEIHDSEADSASRAPA